METRTGFLISQIKLTQRRVFQKLLQNCGVEEFNGPQGNILYVLWQKDSVPIVEIAEKTGLAKNTLTVMLDRMEKNGLVSRKQSADDRRKTLICLTGKAYRLEKDYDRVSQQMNELFFQNLSEKEIRELEKYLDIILENLQQAEKENRNRKEENK
ncbi:MAG: MarR family transcriptional regulator [Bacteroidales bacterium]|nr:MarR family transcriptional regulator [Bacteroidales bacterium]MCM1416651.1 MarR family transcriptional regulator [bacterium]MCM1424779.1 MarR family transcriptional regulator [bacterium]